jgi:hypothetical protein
MMDLESRNGVNGFSKHREEPLALMQMVSFGCSLNAGSGSYTFVRISP